MQKGIMKVARKDRIVPVKCEVVRLLEIKEIRLTTPVKSERTSVFTNSQRYSEHFSAVLRVSLAECVVIKMMKQSCWNKKQKQICDLATRLLKLIRLGVR